MSAGAKKRKWLRWMVVAALAVLALPLALMALVSSSMGDDFIRRTIVEQINKATRGVTELRSFHFDAWRLHVTLTDFTIHGREPAGTPPFFHADRIELGLRIDSWWGRKFSLAEVEVMRPAVHVRVERDGSTNVPLPSPQKPGKPWRERVFELVVRRLRLDDGEMLYNDVRIPLVAQGGRFDLSVDYAESEGQKMYLGQFRWQQMEVVARRYLPFLSDMTVRFTLQPDSLTVTQLVWQMPHSSLDAQFSNSSFAQPAWAFRYRGHLDLEDIRIILRKPNSPGGRVDFTGEGRFSKGQLSLAGAYSAADIQMPYQWFHATGITSRGSYHASRSSLEVPDFYAQALGGGISGHVQLDFHGLRFRVQAQAQTIDLATLLAAVDNASLPVIPLHWGGSVDVQALTTWTADFKNLDSRGVSLWTPGPQPHPEQIPVTARLDYQYSMASRSVVLAASDISTPTSHVQFTGTLGARDSAMNAIFDSQDLTNWDDFINRIRGRNADPRVIAGRVHWQGRMTGPLARPTFSGHVKGNEARYDRLYWDEVEGDMTYSPDNFRFVRANVRRGPSSAQLELSLTLHDWNFPPESPWEADATLVRTDTDGLQALLGYSYPAHGMLSGSFHGRGTRANPEITGLFDVIDPEAWGWRIDRAGGQIAMRRGEVRINNAELRLLPPPASGTPTPAAPGVLTGNFDYRTTDGQAVFDLTGAALPLEGIARIQTPRLPIGGRVSFHLNGQGPLFAPTLDGSLRLVDLRLGNEVIGSFESGFHSDGMKLMAQISSAISTGELHGEVGVSLRGAYPVSGEIMVAQLDLDPLIVSALHLSALTGHSHVSGGFTISGDLLRPETLGVRADLSQVTLDYEYLKLENAGPVRFQYAGHTIQVEQATLRGTDSNFRIGGSARFSGDRAVDLSLAGAVDLRLFGEFIPRLDARGPAVVDAGISGTLSDPRITGRVHVENGSLRYGDFPAGLSQVSGEFVFDTSRLSFDNVTSETGGGRLQLSGALTYGNGPFSYDLSARTEQVRIRYPAGMSWLAGGTVRLAGTAQAATLSGHVTVERLLMSPGFELTSLISTSNEGVAAPTTTSPFLRNLQFDVQADTTPGAVLEWSAGRSQTEANVRVRGTWEHPILLGNVHLLSGDITLRGNQYRLARGDINFVNPFRVDPEINLEATTTIQQYDVTVDFSGPASHLTMSYRSDPPLPSSDIITLLALGQTGAESRLRGGPAAVQTPELGATMLLSEAISSQLGGRVQRLFGIRHFSVDPNYIASTSASQNPAARVTIAQQFSRNLTITYSTDVTSTQQQIIQIEYTVRPDLSVIALRDANGTFGIDIVRRVRFK